VVLAFSCKIRPISASAVMITNLHHHMLRQTN
jgi:hypothetical protein